MIDNYSDDSDKKNFPPDYSFSNEISTATLVKVLIRKGILTPSEILDEERNTRLDILEEYNKTKKIKKHRHKRSKLKKWAARHRWSRRLTTKIFGWEWKKVRHYHYINLRKHQDQGDHAQ